jgi:FtsP/CotA-like multicopper oxidase with cupredoxin domain
VSEHNDRRGPSRRTFLLGGAGVAAGAALSARSLSSGQVRDLGASARAAAGVIPDVHLAATDGFVAMPWASPAIAPFWPDPLAPNPTYGTGQNLYVFGFRDMTNVPDNLVVNQRGLAQISAPILAFDEGQQVRIRLSNLGLSVRPDLTDGHTIHWHGFVNAIPLFDGVPELSISVPIGRDFTYFYRPHDPGTYMYHCHFEDVEHVQMGMTGSVFVRPKQNGTPIGGFTKFAYNDGDGSTGYHREFAFLLSEVWAEGHYRDAHIQTTDWTDFKPSFWCLNGRSYPDTLVAPGSRDASGNMVAPAGAPQLKYQPNTALVQANAGDRVLLRLSNLGYQNHAMTVDGIDLRVVAKDATRLKSYLDTNTVDIGPGESRDVLFTAPPNAGSSPITYLFYDRNLASTSNAGGAGLGGMATEIRVHPAGALAPQTRVNG